MVSKGGLLIFEKVKKIITVINQENGFRSKTQKLLTRIPAFEKYTGHNQQKKPAERLTLK